MKKELHFYLVTGGATLLLLFFVSLKNVKAQSKTVVDSVEYAFLPAIAYNSDLGFVGGGLVSRYHYRDEKPFHSYMNVLAVASTKGFLSGEFFLDQPRAFDSDIRMTTELYASRFFQDQYYGYRNYSRLQDEPEDKPDYYLFQSFSAGLELTGRKQLFGNGEMDLDLRGIAAFDYQTPWENNTDHLIAVEQPLGYEGGRVMKLGAGLVWESRDNEFNPNYGSYQTITAELSRKELGSSYNFFRFEIDARFYTTFHLVKDITFASRFLLLHTTGSVPYWELAYLGGEESLRGYPKLRFLDDNSLLVNSELRTWLFDVPQIKSKFGGNLFFDVGRTYNSGNSFDTIAEDLKYTLGVGAVASFFTPDFIVRGDVGFSEEGHAVYINIGYMF